MSEFRKNYKENKQYFNRRDFKTRKDFKQAVKEFTAEEMAKEGKLKDRYLKYLNAAVSDNARNFVESSPSSSAQIQSHMNSPQILNDLQNNPESKFTSVPGAQGGPIVTNTLADRNIKYRQAFAKSQGLGNAYDASGNSVKGASTADITKIQQMLIDKGYDLGKTGADGLWGRKSQAAWAKYQDDLKRKQSPEGKAAERIAANVGLGSTQETPYATRMQNNREAQNRAQAVMYSNMPVSYNDSVPTQSLDSAALAFYKNPVALMDSLNNYSNRDSTNIQIYPFVTLPSGEQAYNPEGPYYYNTQGDVINKMSGNRVNLFTGNRGRDTLNINGAKYHPVGDSVQYVNPADSSYYSIRFNSPDSAGVVTYKPQLIGADGTYLYNPSDSIAYTHDSIPYVNRGHGYVPQNKCGGRMKKRFKNGTK